MDPSAWAVWNSWIASEWPDLVKKGRAVVPIGMPSPKDAGFSEPLLSERAGQARDWVLGAADGSRLHLHEYPDGTMTLHRDAVDPGRGPLHAAVHVLTETSFGRFIVFLLVASAVGWGMRRLGTPMTGGSF